MYIMKQLLLELKSHPGKGQLLNAKGDESRTYQQRAVNITAVCISEALHFTALAAFYRDSIFKTQAMLNPGIGGQSLFSVL